MSSLRLLAVQSTPTPTAESAVLRGLLEPDSASSSERADVLLYQGIDSTSPIGRSTAEAFAELPDIDLRTFNIGSIGKAGMSGVGRALKVFDLWRLVAEQHRLLDGARAFQPDVVYSSQQRRDLKIADYLSQHLGIPRVVHLHYIVGPWLGRGSIGRLCSAQSVIAVSDFIRSDVIRCGVDPSRVHTLRNSMEMPHPDDVQRAVYRAALRSEIGAPRSSLIVGMVARLSTSKCQIELLDAMVPVLQSRTDVHLVYAGAEYPPGNGIGLRLRQMAQADSVPAQVHILGQRSDVPALLEAFDIFAHPSLADPCPLAVLEAMSHRLSVIAWKDGGLTEMVVDSETGILAPTGDIKALRLGLLHLLDNPDIRNRYGLSGAQRIHSHFSPDEARSHFRRLLWVAAGLPRASSDTG